jgi:hypothetical protein
MDLGTFNRRRQMQLINNSLFARLKAFIAQTGRVNMRYWGGVLEETPATFVGEIRMLNLFNRARTFACIAGSLCFLATGEELMRATRRYRLTGGAIDDPEVVAAALLIGGSNDVKLAVATCQSFFRLTHWPEEERAAYCNCETDAERKEIVLRRLERWTAGIDSSRKVTPSHPRPLERHATSAYATSVSTVCCVPSGELGGESQRLGGP